MSELWYKRLGLKDKLDEKSEADMVALLATDGKWIKRSVLVSSDRIWVGFEEEEWRTALGR